MSLVQAGADVSGVWQTFVKTFPGRRTASTSQPITFQQMVVCEVLTQVIQSAFVSQYLFEQLQDRGSNPGSVSCL